MNQIRTIPESTRYSYVFEGESGTLDYALTSSSLSVTGATIWHINSDEPRIPAPLAAQFVAEVSELLALLE